MARGRFEVIFDGSSGRRPSAEARRYVYSMLVKMIAAGVELHPHGWLFGGVEDEFDQRRLRKAARSVANEMKRKSER